MKKPISVKPLDNIGREDVEMVLGWNLRFEVRRPTHRDFSFYDTFDWRLFRRGLMLVCSDSEYALTTFAGGQRVECDMGNCRPRFAWDFPEGKLRSMLEPLLRERALLSIAAVTVEETSYTFLDDAHKTVARMTFAIVKPQAESVPPATATYVTVQPLRGYGGQARRLAAVLSASEVVPVFDAALYKYALEAAGKLPGSYDSQLDVRLEPEMCADDAVKAILRRLFEVLQANEAGICADIDTEFLHDYRVTVRRMRSAVSQMRKVFPADATNRMKQDFRTLTDLTSLLRDLDVYLLAKADSRAMVPAVLSDDITPLFDRLQMRRTEAFEHVIQELGSARYARFLADYEVFLSVPGYDDPTAVNAARPIGELASVRIYKRYRRIVKDGKYILKHNEDDLLHALRLESKRLRYLLEFFANLFPRKQVVTLVGQLKKLQENLGEFSDLAVQQEALLAFVAELPIDDPQT